MRMYNTTYKTFTDLVIHSIYFIYIIGLLTYTQSSYIKKLHTYMHTLTVTHTYLHITSEVHGLTCLNLK